ncbi:MAG: carboxypeptidase regulatory-like domain-containing protein [Ruminococcus sp.]|nr:carboxypeptidase regulatory-like domain-containing protein [Ruminococcus sp.]
MGFCKKLVSAVLVTAAMLSASIIPSFAATTSNNGVEVSFTTDKTEYSVEENISAILSVTNNGSFNLVNVSLDSILPEGYVLADEYSNTKTIDKLAVGETVTLEVIYAPELQPTTVEPTTVEPTTVEPTTVEPTIVEPITVEPTTVEPTTEMPETTVQNTTVAGATTANTNATISKATTAPTSKVENTSVKTGQHSGVALLLLIIFASAVVVLVMVKKGKSKQFIAVALCLSLVGGMAIYVPVANASELLSQTINTETTVKVGNDDLTLNAVVKYDVEAPEITPTPQDPVTDLDENNPDIEIYSFNADTDSIEINSSSTVTFTAEIFSNIDMSEYDVTVIDTYKNEIGTMNDNGENGDETANDGIYTLQTELASNQVIKMNYFVVAGECISNAVSIGFYAPLTDEEWENIDKVDFAISDLMSSDDFNDKSEADKIVAVGALLNSFVEQNLIVENTVAYDETEKLFVFEYSCGIEGGISFAESNDDLNAVAGGSDSSNAEPVAIEYSNNSSVAVNGGSYSAIVFNGFENSSYRRDFYNDLKTDWDNIGLNTTVDVDVTVKDIKNISTSYDVVVFAMHGSMYKFSGKSQKEPVICLNENVTTTTNKAYTYELVTRKSVAKVYCTDGAYHYWVSGKFFTDSYTTDGLDGKLIFSESCMFYGCDCQTSTPNNVLANAIYSRSAEAVIGYHNSVGANYSRNVMKFVIEATYNGDTVAKAVENAKEKYGNDDNWEDASDDKYKAYPIITGNDNFVLRGNGVIAGRVMNAADNARIANALIRVYDSNGEIVATARTNQDGDYSINIPAGEYIVDISAGDYRTIRFSVIVEAGQTTYNASTLLMYISAIDSNEVNGIISNSITAEGVGNVTIKVRNNWNNKNGVVLLTNTTNSNGYYHFEYRPGFYTLELSKEGFITGYKNIFIGLGLSHSQDATISPIEVDGTYRIVLTWGENPCDVDSHVYGPLTNGDHFHVYYNNKYAYDGNTEVCNLDVDDVTSYGPETITLTPHADGAYYYYIYKYSGYGYLSTSNSQINVYQGSTLIKTFNVPVNQGNSDFWNVFAIKDGRMIINNTITSEPNLSYAE